MSATIVLDLLTIIFACYVLVSSLKNRDFFPSWVAGVYLVAQSGWTVSFLQGNFWGAVLNNYIWFIFNTSVFGYLIWKEWKK